jgi:Dihydrodipicolinate synthetase family
VRVIGNTGSNSTREAVHATSQGFAVGMHAALQINPYYGKTSATGLRRHFQARGQLLQWDWTISMLCPAAVSAFGAPEMTAASV